MEDDDDFDDSMFDIIDTMVQQHESSKAQQHAAPPQMQPPSSPNGVPRPAANSHSPSAQPNAPFGMQPQPHPAPSATYAAAPGAHALSGHHGLPAQLSGQQPYSRQHQASSAHTPVVAASSMLPPPGPPTSAGLHPLPPQQQLHPHPAMPHKPGDDAPPPVSLPHPLPHAVAHAQNGWPHVPSSFAAQQQQLQQGVHSGQAQSHWQQQQQQQQHLRQPQPLLAPQPQRGASNGSQGMSAISAHDASALHHHILPPAAAPAAAPPPAAGASRVGLAGGAGGGAAAWGGGAMAHPPAAHMPLQHQRQAHATAEHSRQLQQLQQQLEFARHEADELRRRARDGDARAIAAEKQLSGVQKERQRQESLRVVAEAELRQERERKALHIRQQQQQQQQQQPTHTAPIANGHSSFASTMEHMDCDAGHYPPSTVDGQGVQPHQLPAQQHAHAPVAVATKALSPRREESAAVQHPTPPLQAPPAAPTFAPAMTGEKLAPPPAPSAPHPPYPHPNHTTAAPPPTPNKNHVSAPTGPPAADPVGVSGSGKTAAAPLADAVGGSGSGKTAAPAALTAAAATAAGHTPHASTSAPQPALVLLPPPPAQLPPRRPRLWHKLWASTGPAMSVLTGAPVPAMLEAAMVAAEAACGSNPRTCDGWMHDLQGGWVQGGARGGAACYGSAQTTVLSSQQGDGVGGAVGRPVASHPPELQQQSVEAGPQGRGVVGGVDLEAALVLLGRSLAALRVQLQQLSVDGLTDAGGAAGTGSGCQSFGGHRFDTGGGSGLGKRLRGRGGAARRGSGVEHGEAGVQGSCSSSSCSVDSVLAQGSRVGSFLSPPSGAVAATLVCVLDFLSSSACASSAAAAVASEQASHEEPPLAAAGLGNRAANSQLASAQGGSCASLLMSDIQPWVVAALQLLQALLTHSDAAYPILMGNSRSPFSSSSSSSSSSQGHGTVNTSSSSPSDARAGLGRSALDCQQTRVLPLHVFSGRPPLTPPQDPQAKQQQQQQQQQQQPLRSLGSDACNESPVPGGSKTHGGGLLHAMLGVLHRLVLVHASNMQLLACVAAVADAAARQLPALTVRQALLSVLRWRLLPSPRLPPNTDNDAGRGPCPMDADNVCDGGDEDDNDDDDSPLMLEALLCSADTQHQIVGVALLHALLESPQVLHAMRAAGLPGSWMDAPHPSQNAAAAAPAAGTADTRQAPDPPPHAPSPHHQQHHQQVQQSQLKHARLNALCVQHMLAALLDCLQLEQASPEHTPEQCHHHHHHHHHTHLSNLLHRAFEPAQGIGGLGWGLGSSLSPHLTFPFPHSGSITSTRGSAASSITGFGGAHGSALSYLSGSSAQGGAISQGCSLPSSGSLREGVGGVFGGAARVGGGGGLMGKTSLPDVASAGGLSQQAMGGHKGSSALVGGYGLGSAGFSSGKSGGWGVFELQRRAVALLSLLLAERQERLLASMCVDAPYLGQQEGSTEAGGGLAHRLLLLAASAVMQAEGGWMRGCINSPCATTDGCNSSGVGDQGGGVLGVGKSLQEGEVENGGGGGGRVLHGGAAPPVAAVWWCEGVRLAMEALLLLKELLTSGDDALRAAAVQGTTSIHPEAQNAAHTAVTQLLELKVPPPLQPALTALDLHQGLPLASWAHRPALAAHKGPVASLVAGGGWGGYSSGSSSGSGNNHKGKAEGGRVVGADSGVPGAKGLVLGRLQLGGGVDTLVQVASSVARRAIAQLYAVRQDAA